MATRQWTRGTAAARLANVSVPAAGELGVETDTANLVVADGTNTWAALGTLAKQSSLALEISNRTAAVALTEKTANRNVANGYAGLDAGGKVLVANLPSTVVGALEYQGTYDASTAVYPASPSKGFYYIVSVAGTISGTAFKIGDWLTYDGTAWDKIDNGQNVSSVAGRQGAIILAEADITNLPADLASKASLASPTFTGTPAVPTAATNTNTTQIANTAFVATALAGSVVTVAGRTGNVVLAEADITNLPADLAAKSPLASPAFTGTPTVPTASAGTSTIQIATTQFVTNAVGSSVLTVAGRTGNVVLAESDITNLASDLAARSLIASPTFTGTPAAPTAAALTSTTQLATTSFVTNAVNSAATSFDGGVF